MSKASDLEKENWTIFWRNRKRNLWGVIADFLSERIMFKEWARLIAQNSERGMVLEAGSGYAHSSVFLGEMRGDSIFALDISTEALLGAIEFGKDHSVTIEAICGDLRNMPFRNKTFDLVFSGGVIEHFKEPIEIVREMRRISKINIAVVPGNGLSWRLAKRIKAMLGEDKGISELHYDYYDFEYASYVFKEAGYNDIKIEKYRTMLIPLLGIIGRG
jgi:SAM-dependent methyltransferase